MGPIRSAFDRTGQSRLGARRRARCCPGCPAREVLGRLSRRADVSYAIRGDESSPERSGPSGLLTTTPGECLGRRCDRPDSPRHGPHGAFGFAQEQRSGRCPRRVLLPPAQPDAGTGFHAASITASRGIHLRRDPETPATTGDHDRALCRTRTDDPFLTIGVPLGGETCTFAGSFGADALVCRRVGLPDFADLCRPLRPEIGGRGLFSQRVDRRLGPPASLMHVVCTASCRWWTYPQGRGGGWIRITRGFGRLMRYAKASGCPNR
jgi:hypothetical protein